MTESAASFGGSKLALVIPFSVRFWFGVTLAAMLAFVLAPIVSLTLNAFSESSIQTYTVTGFTLKWFGSVLHDPLYLRGASNSFVIACAAAAISVLLGTISALAIGRGYIRNPLLYLGLVGTPAIFPLLLTGMAVAGYFQFLGLQGTTLAVVIVHTAYAS